MAWPGRAPGASAANAVFRVPEIVRGAARSADTAARTARGRSRDRGGLSPSKARHNGAVRTDAAPMAKSAGMKTNPTQPLHAGVAVRSAAIAARASIRVKAAFSDALPSERGKPMPNSRGHCTFQDRGEGLRWSSWRGHGERQGHGRRWAQESDHSRHRKPGEQPRSRNKRHEARAEESRRQDGGRKPRHTSALSFRAKAEVQRSTAERAARARSRWRPAPRLPLARQGAARGSRAAA